MAPKFGTILKSKDNLFCIVVQRFYPMPKHMVPYMAISITNQDMENGFKLFRRGSTNKKNNSAPAEVDEERYTSDGQWEISVTDEGFIKYIEQKDLITFDSNDVEEGRIDASAEIRNRSAAAQQFKQNFMVFEENF